MEYACTGCDATMTEPIEADPDAHVWDEGVILCEATETEDGVIEYTCTLCGAKRTALYPYTPKPTVAVSIGSEKVKRNESVTVSVLLRNNPGISALRLHLDYDHTVFALSNVVNGDVFSDEYFTHSESTEDRPYTVFWMNRDGDLTQDGVLVFFTFLVLDKAPFGSTEVTVTYDEGSAFNADMQLVPFRMVNGSIRIVPLLGDVNDDKEINVKDVVVLQRYLAGWKNITINFENSDINEDGVVDLRDLYLLIRYIVGGYGIEL
jgi:hypothetical protein